MMVGGPLGGWLVVHWGDGWGSTGGWLVVHRGMVGGPLGGWLVMVHRDKLVGVKG